MKDGTSLTKIKQMDEVTNMFAKELKRFLECEDKLDQADWWKEKRNKAFRKMMDWFLVEDGNREA